MIERDLRLSALRAFLGRIHREIRLIKLKAVDKKIVVTIIVDSQPSERLSEAIGEATTEIIADFSDMNHITEVIEVSKNKIAREDIFKEGWVYERAE